MKKVRIILSPEAEEVYKYLSEQAATSKIERGILRALNNKIEMIKINIHFGNPISRDKIPEEYHKKYGITNLFRIELPNYWRMLYSLTDNEAKVEN